MHTSGPVDWITAGAVGEIGARTFLIQFSSDAGSTCLIAEKEQIAALGRYIDALLTEAGEPAIDTNVAVDAPPVRADLEVNLRAMEIGMGVTSAGVGFRFICTDDEGAEQVVELECTRMQARLMGARALADVDAGRPLCEVCGLPIEPQGHDCPARNGHHTGP